MVGDIGMLRENFCLSIMEFLSQDGRSNNLYQLQEYSKNFSVNELCKTLHAATKMGCTRKATEVSMIHSYFPHLELAASEPIICEYRLRGTSVVQERPHAVFTRP
jgi:hypothetical protein